MSFPNFVERSTVNPYWPKPRPRIWCHVLLVDLLVSHGSFGLDGHVMYAAAPPLSLTNHLYIISVASQPLFMSLSWSRVIIGSIGDSPNGQRNRGDRQVGLSRNPAEDISGPNGLINLSRYCVIFCAVNRGMYFP